MTSQRKPPPVDSAVNPIGEPPVQGAPRRGWPAILPGGLALHAGWVKLRNRLLADRRFQRFAARFPLTRPVTRKRSGELFDLVSGFIYTQTLSACVETGIIAASAEVPRSINALALHAGLPEDRMRILVESACALRLLERVGPKGTELYAPGDLGGALLGNPGVEAMIRHHEILYRDTQDPVALLRSVPVQTELTEYWAYARQSGARDLDADQVGAYSELMAVSQAFIAESVLDAYPLDQHRRLIDIGGGEGAFVCAAAKRFPNVNYTVFDLPAVADRANARFAQAGIAGHAHAVGGDLYADDLPKDADIISLIRVLYDHNDAAALAILKSVHAALPKGSRLIVAEPMAGVPGAEKAGSAYFGFYLLAMGSGRCRRPDQHAALMRAAGFEHPRSVAVPNPLLTSVMIADRP